MGLGIAQATARAGFETIMAKATPGGVDAQRGRVEKQLQKDVERGKLTAADHGALLERLCWTTHLHDLARVTGNGAARLRSGSSVVPVFAWCCR